MKKKKGKKTNTFFEVRVLDDYNKFTVNVLKRYTLDTSSMNLTTLSFLGTKSVDAQFLNEQIVDLKELPQNSV